MCISPPVKIFDFATPLVRWGRPRWAGEMGCTSYGSNEETKKTPGGLLLGALPGVFLRAYRVWPSPVMMYL